MPALPQTFDAYPVAITLDGSGAGTVQFQPNGCTVSISRLFVQVSTSVKQATVTLYKGSISPTTAIETIVSGSTGGMASGQIFVTDGQILYVVWTGGDAGSTATATFSGKQIPFNQVGSDTITWTDPIAASDGSLIFPAIKSPNYVAGSVGWVIRRDGTFEFSGGTVRGDLIVTGAGNSFIEATTQFGQPVIFMRPPDFAGGIPTLTGATLEALSFNSGNSAQCQWVILGPYPQNGSGGSLIWSSTSDDRTIGSNIQLAIGTFNINGALQVGGKDVGKGLWARVDATTDSSAVGSASEAVVLTLPSATYKAGRAYNVVHKGQATMGTAITNNILNFRIRKTNVAGSVVRFLGRTAQVSTQTMGIDQQGIFTVTGSDVTAVLVLCLATPTGSTGTHNADPTFPREVNIYDIGVATDYPNAPQLT